MSRIQHEHANWTSSALPVETIANLPTPRDNCTKPYIRSAPFILTFPPLPSYTFQSFLHPLFCHHLLYPETSYIGANLLQCFNALRVRSLHDAAPSTSCHFHPARFRATSLLSNLGPRYVGDPALHIRDRDRECRTRLWISTASCG